MNILFIIKVKNLIPIKFVMHVSLIMLSIDPRMVSIFWARSSISLKQMCVCVFFQYVLGSTPNQRTLKYN